SKYSHSFRKRREPTIEPHGESLVRGPRVSLLNNVQFAFVQAKRFLAKHVFLRFERTDHLRRMQVVPASYHHRINRVVGKDLFLVSRAKLKAEFPRCGVRANTIASTNSCKLNAGNLLHGRNQHSGCEVTGPEESDADDVVVAGP